MDWTSGLGGVGGRGRASTYGAFSWVGGSDRQKTDFEFFWGREGGVPGRGRQRPGMDWPSGLGGVGGRGRASTHGAEGGGRLGAAGVVRSRAQGAGVVGRSRNGVRSQGGVQGMQGPGQRGRVRWRASTHGAFVFWRLQIVGSNPTKKLILSFFGAGKGRQRRELGGGS